MAQFSHINSDSHALLKIEKTYNIEKIRTLSAMMVYPSEIAEVQKEYAILFRKHPETGRLFPNILLGFADKENLFLDEKGDWQASYVPLSIQKGPFLITNNPDVDKKNDVIAIDLDDPRVNDKIGEAIFDDKKQATPYLDKINQMLAQMHLDSQRMSTMVDTFTDLALIEPVTLNIQLNNGELINFGGAYTIAQEKIDALTGKQLKSLNKAGYLSIAIYIADSLSNITKLIDKKNNQ